MQHLARTPALPGDLHPEEGIVGPELTEREQEEVEQRTSVRAHVVHEAFTENTLTAVLPMLAGRNRSDPSRYFRGLADCHAGLDARGHRWLGKLHPHHCRVD
jgi:hypothetical protein